MPSLAARLVLLFTTLLLARPAPRATTAEDAHLRVYPFAGTGGSSRIERRVSAGGGEDLRGKTTLTRAAEALRETALLAPSGRLLHAEIELPGARFVLDPGTATVRIERVGAAPMSWRVPADAPWVYRAGSGRRGLIASPLAGWVAMRAAASATVVRVIEPERRRSYLVPIDQVVVATELGTTVVLGDDAIDADDRFVTEVRLIERDITLRRVDVGPS